MKVEICTDSSEIDLFNLKNAEFNSYHYFRLSKWTNLITDFFNFKCFNLVSRENGNIVAHLPIFLVKSKIFKNHFVSIPFCGHGGGLVVEESKNKVEIFKLFLLKLEKLAKEYGVEYIQIRGPEEKYFPDYLYAGFKEPLLDFNFILNLDGDLKNFKKGIDKKLRNILKKAEENGVTVEEKTNEYGIKILYKMHLKTMKRLGTPPKSINFFLSLLRTGNYHIYCAKLDEKVIAVSTFFMDKKYATWYDGVSLEEYKRFNATSLILFKFIEKNLSKLNVIDLGTSREGSSNYHYKMQWKPLVVKASKLYYFFNKDEEVVDVRDNKYSGLSNIWRKYVPPFMATLIGPKIRKGMGS